MMACIYFEKTSQIYFLYLCQEEEGEEDFSFTVIAYRDFSLVTPLVGTKLRRPMWDTPVCV